MNRRNRDTLRRQHGVVLPLTSVFLLIVGVIVASGQWRAVLAARMATLDGERLQAVELADNTVRRLQARLDSHATLSPPGYYDAPLPLGGGEHFWQDAPPPRRAGTGVDAAVCAGRYHWSWDDCATPDTGPAHWVVERMPSNPDEEQTHYRITVLSIGPQTARVLLQVYHRVPDSPGSADTADSTGSQAGESSPASTERQK